MPPGDSCNGLSPRTSRVHRAGSRKYVRDAGGDAPARSATSGNRWESGIRGVEAAHTCDKAGVLWPEVMEELIEINSGSYTTCVLTGGIGVAKTTTRPLHAGVPALLS